MSVLGTGLYRGEKVQHLQPTHTQRETIPLYLSSAFFFFFFLWKFPYHLSDRLWDTEKPCWKPHHWGLAQTETHTLHICPLPPSNWNSNADTRSTGWCPPQALTVCPWSCSIFPDKYHPGQSIKDISLFLKHRMILSLPLPRCYVMLRLSLPPISQGILFTPLHALHTLLQLSHRWRHLLVSAIKLKDTGPSYLCF